MEKYINKSALVAEIEKIREHVKRLRYAVDANCIVTVRNACECLESSIDLLVNSIDTLEGEKVDLDKEIDNVWNPHFNLGWDDNSLVSINHKSFESIAKHFFELGLKAQIPIAITDMELKWMEAMRKDGTLAEMLYRKLMELPRRR